MIQRQRQSLLRHLATRLRPSRRALMIANVTIGTAAASLLPATPPADAANKAGVSAAVRGEVARTPVAADAAQPLSSGEDVFMGDGISTGERSGLQLLLLDESVFTIGPLSELVVDEFVYDPQSNTGEMGISFLRGGFRLVTGLVGGEEPEQVNVNLPTATVGVRGTIVSFLVAPDGIYVLLEGPGPGNTGLEREGAVEVTVGGQTILLYRPGFVVKISPDGASVSSPFLADAALLARFRLALGSDIVQTVDLGEGVALPIGDPVLEAEVRSADALENIELFGDLEDQGIDFEDLLPRDDDLLQDPMPGSGMGNTYYFFQS